MGLLTNGSAARSAARAEFKIYVQNACPPTAQTLPLIGGTTAGPAGSSPPKLQRFAMCWKGSHAPSPRVHLDRRERGATGRTPQASTRPRSSMIGGVARTLPPHHGNETTPPGRARCARVAPAW
jgi:hypothetical protein